MGLAGEDVMDARRQVPSLGATIRAARERLRYPMRRIADAVGVSVPFLSDLERDRRSASEAVIRGIARELGTDEEETLATAGRIGSGT